MDKEKIKNRIKELMKIDKSRNWEEVNEDWEELVRLSNELKENKQEVKNNDREFI